MIMVALSLVVPSLVVRWDRRDRGRPSLDAECYTRTHHPCANSHASFISSSFTALGVVCVVNFHDVCSEPLRKVPRGAEAGTRCHARDRTQKNNSCRSWRISERDDSYTRITPDLNHGHEH